MGKRLDRPEGEALASVGMLVTQAEYALVRAEAARSGLSMAQVMRLRLFGPTPPLLRLHDYPTLRLQGAAHG